MVTQKRCDFSPRRYRIFDFVDIISTRIAIFAAMKANVIAEQTLFPELFQTEESTNTTTFQDNMKLPVHRWYRYTAGFSGAWVGQLIEQEKTFGRHNIIDPFAGSGTVMVESMMHGVDSYGVESNPYVYNIAQAKLQWKYEKADELKKKCIDVLTNAQRMEVDKEDYPELITKCFPLPTLHKLEALKMASAEISDKEIRNFVWFIITSILRSTSPVGTAQWQYIQPNKSKSNVLDPFEAYRRKVTEIFSDIRQVEGVFGKSSNSEMLREDARDIQGIPDGWGDLVITSPPYANNYDYADAMRLEMLFWNDISNWKDLQDKVSVKLIRACTQHVSTLKDTAPEYIQSPLLAPIRDELEEKFTLLQAERENHGGKKNYHFMVAAYFYDMAQVLNSLYRVTNQNAKMCFVIGDSAPYGVYIPVDEWLGKLAQASGFNDYTFEKLRDRNIKWKNRKHRVPLKEGRLWINK